MYQVKYYQDEQGKQPFNDWREKLKKSDLRARRVIEARGGVGEIAKRSGLARQNIYRALSAEGNPTIKTLTEITRAAGVRLTPHRL